LVQNAYGNEAVNRSNVFRWYSRFWDGRELVEDDVGDGRPKSTRTEVNIAAVAAVLVKKWPSIRIKNDSRIFEYPLDCSSSDSERGFLLSRFCCCCMIMRQPTKLPVFANFWPNKFYNPLSPPSPHVISIYLCQTTFCSPSWTWS
jgi:hypothetical protein